ncbi:phosphopyruvate hydratase [Aureococcus anophagefferens]|uniref:Phosphopyruvate hydratase n=1 Tax=Aureococcus anophagefferens TaxID=44056 RepID=A0ABR1G3Q8_AURAN
MARFAALRDGGLSARRRRGVAVRTLEQQGVGSLLRLLAVGVAVAVACASAAYRLGGRLRAVAELETFFASDADAAAFATTAAACPRTYVYRLPPRLVDWAPPANPGTRVAPGVYVSADAVGENANLLEVVLDRLSRPESPCVATNPEDAELFLVPILPKSKHWSDWVDACGRLKLERAAAWRKSLPYLDDGNARRHFFVFPRVAYIPKCAGWWATPLGFEPFTQFARVAVGGYEEFAGDYQRGKTLKGLDARQRRRPQDLVPRLVSAPYVAAVRWSVRGAAPCAALAKRNATFCVEPPGLTPGRASIVTALLLGCVPVLFAPEQDRLWPLHWGPFREGSRVMLDAARARADPTYVEAALRAIPPADVAAMRRLVADRAVALQYGLDDVPGDALHVLLRGIRHAAGG